MVQRGGEDSHRTTYLEGPFRRSLHGSLDLVHGRVLGETARQIHDGHVGSRDAESHASQLAEKYFSR